MPTCYIKHIEAAGAIPVPMNTLQMTDEEVVEFMGKVNGVFLTGGTINVIEKGKNTSRILQKSRLIHDTAKEMNDRGIHFPIYGICQGIQEMGLNTMDDISHFSIELFDHANKCDSLTMACDPAESWLLGDYPDYSELESENVFFYHKNGIQLNDFFNDRGMKESWKVLGTCKDKNNVEMVALMEHKQYPFFGTQFHPEKIMAEFHPEANMPHTEISYRIAHYLA